MSIGSSQNFLPPPLPYDPSNGGQNATNFAPGGYYNRTGQFGNPGGGLSIGSAVGPGPAPPATIGSVSGPGPVSPQPVNPWGSGGPPMLPGWGGGGMQPPQIQSNYGNWVTQQQQNPALSAMEQAYLNNQKMQGLDGLAGIFESRYGGDSAFAAGQGIGSGPPASLGNQMSQRPRFGMGGQSVYNSGLPSRFGRQSLYNREPAGTLNRGRPLAPKLLEYAQGLLQSLNQGPGANRNQSRGFRAGTPWQ